MARKVVFVAEKRTGRSTLGHIEEEILPKEGIAETNRFVVSTPKFDLSFQPTEASLYLTPACNLSCNYCYIVPFLKTTDSQLTTGQWKSIIDDLYNSGVRTLKLIGGEALLRRDIVEIIRHSVITGILGIELTTNATIQILAARREALKTFAEMDVQKIVSTSLDGHTAQRNDALRGKFHEVVEGIKFLKELKLPVSLASVVTTENQHDLEEMANFAANLGIDAYQFNNLVPIHFGQRSLVITKTSEKKRIVDRIEALRAKFDPKMIIINRFVPAPNIDQEKFERVAQKDDVRRSSLTGCPAGTREVYVLPDGKLVACPMFIQFPEHHSRDSIAERDFSEVWTEDDRILDFRAHITTPRLFGACSTCSSGSVCKGGCRAMTYFQSGRIEDKDPRCLVE